MAEVLRSTSKIGWSVKTQSAFGTGLAKTDLTEDVKLIDPLIIVPNTEVWTDKGMIGAGHGWATQRGLNKYHLSMELSEQQVPIDFAGMLISLFFGKSTPTGGGTEKTHTCMFDDLTTLDEMKVTSLAVLEDGVDQLVQDVCCHKITISGSGSERLKMGASFLATKLGTPLASYTWPTAAALDYVWNYAGIFTIPGDIKTQIRSFTFEADQAVNMNLAWQKAATEALRLYPAKWPITPDRNAGLRCKIRAEGTDLATFRAALEAGTEMAVTLSCLGAEIVAEGGVYYTVQISFPKAVLNAEPEQSYEGGYLHLDLSFDGNYNTASEGPCEVEIINKVPAYLTAAS